MKKFWEIKAAAEKVGDIYIYGRIVGYRWNDDDVTAKSFKDDLDALGDIDTLNLYVNSSGGSVFTAQTIYSILKRHSAVKNAYVDGLAASAASFLIMAADKIHIPKNATMMIHKPMTYAFGNSTELRKEADVLDKVEVGMIAAYMSHIGDTITEEKLKELLDAESWLTAQECVDYGLADELIEEKNVAACIDSDLIARYKNVPEFLIQNRSESLDEARAKKIIELSQAVIDRVNQTLKF